MKRLLPLAVACLALLPGVALAAPPPKAAPKPAAKLPVDLIVLAGGVLTMDPNRPKLSETAIVISEGRIVELASPSEAALRYEAKETIDRKGSVVMPGLVNTHGHAAMTLMRGIADDKPLMEWLQTRIFPVEKQFVSPEFVKTGTQLACLEMIRGGTTTFTDMYYYESSVAEAVDASGMRGVLGETWLDFPAPGHANLEESIKVTREFLQRWKGHQRITPAVAPHAPYTCSKETYLAAKALADEFKVPLLTHLSETREEQRIVKEKYGMTPTKWLESIGVLGPNVLGAHGVWLDEADMAALAAHHVGISHNPESNMKLASGVAPVVATRKAGVVVGLGTDGVAGSNNDLDMFEAMDFAGKLAKVTTMDPTVLKAGELLRMATVDGAKALGLDETIGSLVSGKDADLIAVEVAEPRARPIYDIESALVYAIKASDVSLTMVRGKVLFDGRSWKTLEPMPIVKKSYEFREAIQKFLAANGSSAPAGASTSGARPPATPKPK